MLCYYYIILLCYYVIVFIVLFWLFWKHVQETFLHLFFLFYWVKKMRGVLQIRMCTLKISPTRAHSQGEWAYEPVPLGNWHSWIIFLKNKKWQVFPKIGGHTHMHTLMLAYCAHQYDLTKDSQIELIKRWCVLDPSHYAAPSLHHRHSLPKPNRDGPGEAQWTTIRVIPHQRRRAFALRIWGNPFNQGLWLRFPEAICLTLLVNKKGGVRCQSVLSPSSAPCSPWGLTSRMQCAHRFCCVTSSKWALKWTHRTYLLWC